MARVHIANSYISFIQIEELICGQLNVSVVLIF